MAKIKPKMLRFNPSDSVDVTGYKMYYEFGGIEVNYDSPPYDLGVQTDNISLQLILGGQEGNINIGIVAYDAAGNESDIHMVVTDYPLDFSAPNAPSGGEVY